MSSPTADEGSGTGGGGGERDRDGAPDRGSASLGRRFAALWSATTASNLGDGIAVVAFPVLAVQLTTSPLLHAGITVARRIPWLLLLLPIGALLDRRDRRGAMVTAQAVRSGLLLVLAAAWALDAVSIVVLYAVVVVHAVCEAVFDTGAQSLLPRIVQPAQLPTANGRLYAAEITASQFAGPPLGGLLLAVAGIGALLTLSTLSASYLVAAMLLAALLPPTPAPAGRQVEVATGMLEGLAFLWRHRALRFLALGSGAISLAIASVSGLYALFALTRMGLTEAQFGLLLMAGAAGSVTGSLLSARTVRLAGRRGTLALSLLGVTLSFVGPALTTETGPVALSFALGGLGMVQWNVLTVSLRQAWTPDAILGRVNAAYRLLAWGPMPLGALIGGGVGEVLSLHAAFGFAALWSAGLLVLVVYHARRGTLRDLSLGSVG